jgi:hypothetical protein
MGGAHYRLLTFIGEVTTFWVMHYIRVDNLFHNLNLICIKRRIIYVDFKNTSFKTFYGLRRGFKTLSLRFILYLGRAAGFELPRYQ